MSSLMKMNESSNQLRNKEKDVVEELKERKTMEGYVVYVQGAGETCSNRFKNIHKSGPKSISEFSTPFNDKHKFKAIREIVQKCNAAIRISRTNEVNFIIVNDNFISMKASKSVKKRDRKLLEKRRSFGQENNDPESLIIHENKKIIKFYLAKKENCKIISAKKFNSIYESYLKPFSTDFHRECGVSIPKEKENFFFSVVPFDDKKLRKYRKSLKRKSKPEFHEFSENKHKKPDVHKLELKSSGNVPIFLDERERNYLRKHSKDLKEKYTKMVENLKQPKKVEEDIPIPAPPKEHKNCIVCFKVYEDFIEHIEGKSHANKTNSEMYKEDYKAIDNLIEELNSSNLELDNSKECNIVSCNETKVSQTEIIKQNTKESCTKSDTQTTDNTDGKSRKQYEEEYDEINDDNSCINQSLLYCVIDQSKENSVYVIPRKYKEEIEQSLEASSKFSFIIEDNDQFSKLEKCVIEISSECKLSG